MNKQASWLTSISEKPDGGGCSHDDDEKMIGHSKADGDSMELGSFQATASTDRLSRQAEHIPLSQPVLSQCTSIRSLCDGIYKTAITLMNSWSSDASYQHEMIGRFLLRKSSINLASNIIIVFNSIAGNQYQRQRHLQAGAPLSSNSICISTFYALATNTSQSHKHHPLHSQSSP